jgi:hypothetical protein
VESFVRKMRAREQWTTDPTTFGKWRSIGVDDEAASDDSADDLAGVFLVVEDCAAGSGLTVVVDVIPGRRRLRRGLGWQQGLKDLTSADAQIFETNAGRQ